MAHTVRAACFTLAVRHRPGAVPGRDFPGPGWDPTKGVGELSDEGVRAAARSVRQFLPELVGAAEAGAVDAEIADLLNRPAGGRESLERLREVLESREGTAEFLDAVLDDDPRFRPPQVRPGATRSFGYTGLPGDPRYVGAPMYHCPEGNDYNYWQLEDEAPPLCPTHRCVLVPT
jgi:hypothetical protein